MRKLLFIDCCIRGEASRTKRIADAFFGALDKRTFEIERLDLSSLNLLPLNKERLEYREELHVQGRLSDPFFDLAKQFATADLIVIAAPFWDMGIPAILKTYLENVSVSSITFGADETGYFGGLCRAEKMVYFTTRGFDIADETELEQASPYLKALVAFFGIRGFDMISVMGTDILPKEEVERSLVDAEKRAKQLARNLSLVDNL